MLGLILWMLKACTPKVIVIATIQMLVSLEIPVSSLSSLPALELGVCSQLLVLISHWEALCWGTDWTSLCLILIWDRTQPCPRHPRGFILKRSHTLPENWGASYQASSAQGHSVVSQPFQMTQNPPHSSFEASSVSARKWNGAVSTYGMSIMAWQLAFLSTWRVGFQTWGLSLDHCPAWPLPFACLF